jgi:phage terminase small subunit
MLLNKRQQAFIVEYQKDFNETQSAIRAGYSEKGAHVQAHRLLKNAIILEELDRQYQQKLKILGISSFRVLREISRIAFHDHRKLYDKAGRLKKPSEWDDDTAAVVAGMTVDTKKVSIKTHSKNEALLALGKYLKIIIEHHDFPDKNGVPQDLTPQAPITINLNNLTIEELNVLEQLVLKSTDAEADQTRESKAITP